MHATNRQQLFPPNDCFSRLVSLLSRYGTNASRLSKLLMTFLKVNNDLLMSIDSFNCRPSPIIRSDPARSTNSSLLKSPLGVSDDYSPLIACSFTVKIVWDRDEDKLSRVAATTLFFSPSLQTFIISCWSAHSRLYRLSTENQLSRSQRIFNPIFTVEAKSRLVERNGFASPTFALKRS